jgi:hypothetical protein
MAGGGKFSKVTEFYFTIFDPLLDAKDLGLYHVVPVQLTHAPTLGRHISNWASSHVWPSCLRLDDGLASLQFHAPPAQA